MKTIILAGGRGTRLWPLSREYYPKQFIRILNKTSLLQDTIKRALLFSKPDEIYIVTNEKYKFIVTRHIKELGVDIPEKNILLEPVAKSTLPAIYFGVKKIMEDYGECTVSVLPSDHYIIVDDNYMRAFKDAEALAEDYLVTFGINPTKPHTGYGYIKPGERIKKGYRIEKFVEKPSYEKAKMYIKEGYLWNSGMFLFNTTIFIDECRKRIPEVVKAFEYDIYAAYERAPEISIDRGLMEKTDRAAVIPLKVTWSDVGSFDALYEIMKKDNNMNAVKGEVVSIDSRNNLIIGKSLVATIGIKNTIIVDSGDAILVCSRENSQKVKDIVRMLKEKRDKRAEIHNTIYKPWGSYTLLEKGQSYKIRRITILPEKGFELRSYNHWSRHWIIIKGTAKIWIDGKELLLKAGESTFIPSGVKYKVKNPYVLPLEMVEVQIGNMSNDN